MIKIAVIKKNVYFGKIFGRQLDNTNHAVGLDSDRTSAQVAGHKIDSVQMFGWTPKNAEEDLRR